MSMMSSTKTDAIDWSKGAAYVNGAFMPISEARVPLTDWAYRRSDVVYDVVSVWDGQFFRLDDHIARFRRSIKRYRFTPQETDAELRQILHRIVAMSGLRSAYVAMDCLRGQAALGIRVPSKAKNYIACYAAPFTSLVPEEHLQRGLKLAISTIPRIPHECVDATAKNFHWGDMNMAMFEAEETGADFPLLLDFKGNLTEGPGFNVFIVRDGVVATPDYNMLEGISRQTVIELCAELGIDVQVRPISAAEVRDADEIFITSTAGGVIGASQIDGRIMNNDRPGPVSSELRETYWEKRKSGWHTEPVNYDAV
ncbi:aminotransferase class IV [Paracoccus siganidrum]|uniref:Probable branched-chain-amino-acid aminotransferase n=1 Tax=Paracoccus siganidrum TaxID=1276757 RepID=A0A418ZXS7_9RHOB|nr:aminotransferase class IV [Paracoccus siganidrum]RJL05345.1 branched-chain amino acid--2-keto-4-methylthiobutyrate aminotransferase [Paracoccus siganidrum]